jgi:hypothetical protein
VEDTSSFLLHSSNNEKIFEMDLQLLTTVMYACTK